MSHPSLPDATLQTALVALLGALATADLALLVVPLPTSQVELLRLLLAVGAFLALFLALVVGIAHSPVYAIGAVLVSPLVALYGYTGLLLPWTQLSFTLGQVGIELALSVPVIGEPLAAVLLGGTTLGQATLQTSFRYHYGIVALTFVGVGAAVGTVGWRHVVATRSGDRSRN